jgi:hypothetical protein
LLTTVAITPAILEAHGIFVAGRWAEHFNVGWLLRAAQRAGADDL